jgi:multiple sugar transport system substrate-binding protein
MFYYRKDAFENPAYQTKFKAEFGYALPIPPKNWTQVLDVAKFFNGWDWAHTGKKQYGIDFIAQQNTQAEWSLLDLVAQYATVEGPVSNYASNIFFDTNTMKSLANTPGWIRALTMIKKLTQYGPPGLLGYGYSEERSAFVSGNAAMAFDWEDIAIQAQSPKRYGSTVKGKLGYAPLPGATEYWDRQTNQWVKKQHQVNFLDFGGWFMIIPKDAPHPAAAYKFATFISTKKRSLANVDGQVGYTGSNQWRKSQFTDVNAWVAQGWTRAGATSFLNTTYKIISDPNALLDLAIPGAAEYYNALDSSLAKVLTGEVSPAAAGQNIYNSWNRITDQHGLAKQKAIYRGLLGLSQ